MITKADIDAGLHAHAKWKRRLTEAVKHQSSAFDPTVVANPHVCEFGVWLDALSPAEKNTEDYREVVELHANFHQTAGEILRLATSGRTADAMDQLKTGGSYTTASGRLVIALQRWKSKLSR